MVRDSAKREILRLVAQHDGEWSWYQVERLLSAKGKETGPFFAEVDVLVKDGMMEVRPNPKMDHHGRYWITEKGRQTLAACADLPSLTRQDDSGF